MKRRLCDRPGVQKTAGGVVGCREGERAKSEWKQGEFSAVVWVEADSKAVAVYLLIAPYRESSIRRDRAGAIICWLSEQHGHMISRTDGGCNVGGGLDGEGRAHRKNAEIGGTHGPFSWTKTLGSTTSSTLVPAHDEHQDNAGLFRLQKALQ